MTKKQIVQKAGLAVMSILLSLLLAEGVLRLIYHQSTRYYVWQPGLRYTFHPDSSIFYGIHGEKNFTINRDGIRGDAFSDSTDNYLCIGGSTTECLYLDDKETWCYQLQQQMNRARSRKWVVGNIGKSGTTTREHYIQMKYVVPGIKRLDAVILMVGLNDLMKRLSRDTLFENDFQFTPALEDSLVNTTLSSNNPKHEKRWWRRFLLYKVLQSFAHKIGTNKLGQAAEDDKGLMDKRWRQNRQSAKSLIDTLPDLTSALNQFERNLSLIAAEAHKQNLQMAFINQAAIYKDSMGAFENSLLWMGGLGNFQKEPGHSYYSTRALRKGLDMYNERLKQFCDKNHFTLIDIGILPRDTSVFYDDCHFNEKGAELLGKYLAKP
jgi:lysophospholipase L1-like esterase